MNFQDFAFQVAACYAAIWAYENLPNFASNSK